MNVITITSDKGGTGKTTLTTHLGALLAAWGLSVMVIDADPQGQTSLSYGLGKSPGLYNALVNRLELKRVIKRPSAEVVGELAGDLFVLPGDKSTQAIATRARITDLQDFCQSVASHIDVAIIDTAPTPGPLMALIYQATDYIIVPASLNYLDLDGMVSTIESAQAYEHKVITVGGIIPNFMDRRTARHKSNLIKLKDEARVNGYTVYPAMNYLATWGDASQLGQMVYVLEPKGRAALELKEVALQVAALIGEHVEVE